MEWKSMWPLKYIDCTTTLRGGKLSAARSVCLNRLANTL
jgi:hypothetical protein